MIKEIQNIYYVAVNNAVLPESLTMIQLADFLAKTSSSSLFHQYEIILTLDSAGWFRVCVGMVC